MIGIIAASEDELKPILEKMSIADTATKALLKFHQGTLSNIEVVAVYSGVCKVNAAIAMQVLIDFYSPKKVYITGVAGALDDTLQVGTTVLVKAVTHHDVDPKILIEYHPFMNSNWYPIASEYDISAINNHLVISNMATGEKFITQAEKDEISRIFNAHCVDMESAAYAQVCYANNVPLTILKTITDNANDVGICDFEKNVEHCSRLSAIEVIRLIECDFQQ